MAAAAILDFKIDEILFTSLCQISSKLLSIAEILQFFGIFKMANAAILDFQNREILLSHRAQSAEMH